MAIVEHEIHGNFYAYNHHRVGKKIVCDYLGRMSGLSTGTKGNSSWGQQYTPLEQKELPSDVPSNVTQYPTKQSNFKEIELLRHEKVGQTEIWRSSNIEQKQAIKISEILSEQKEVLRPGVEEVEIYSGNESYAFKVGESEFTAAAHWSQKHEDIPGREKGRIRIFGAANIDESILYHETGHALWDKLQTDVLSEMSEKTNVKRRKFNTAVFEKLPEIRRQKIRQIEKKYEPLIEADLEKRKTISDKLARFTSFGNIEEREKLKTDLYNIERYLKRKYKKRDAEIDTIVQRIDINKAIETYTAKFEPTHSKISAFIDATDKEGGITSYAKAYIKSGESTQFTENFAEASRIFLSSSPEQHSTVSQSYREQYPKTFKAFREIVEPLIVGWSKKIRTVSAEENKLNYERYQKEAAERRYIPLSESEQTEFKKQHPEQET